jgi:predicted nucleotidyltransferase
MSVSRVLTADDVITALCTHAAELQQAGVRHVGLFGSVARGEGRPDSDIDLVVQFDPDARIGLFRLVSLERRLSEILGHSVDLLPEPIEQPRLRANVDRDRRSAF